MSKKLYPGINCSPDNEINGKDNDYIEIPIYSEEQDENGCYQVIGYHKEYTQ